MIAQCFFQAGLGFLYTAVTPIGARTEWIGVQKDLIGGNDTGFFSPLDGLFERNIVRSEAVVVQRENRDDQRTPRRSRPRNEVVLGCDAVSPATRVDQPRISVDSAPRRVMRNRPKL